jgi:phenylpropionate dioxygenase-like ring-hydroxylating dioxygenase large terminal subunit
MSLSAAEKRLHPKLKFSPDAARSATLPAYYYYDPDVYEREKQEIFYKTWQYVGYLKDLQKAGDYITADIIDQKILVVRGKDDRLRAFYNVCMHRGHVLAEGKGNKTIFTCPFHAWSYDATGELKAAGNAENVAGFELTDFHLSEVLVETFGGMVYVNLDPSAPTLHSMAGGLEKEFQALVPRFHELTYARTDVFDIECNWKFVFDQMECYHCPHIHPQIMGRDDSYLEPSFDITAYDYWSQHFVAGNKENIDAGKADLPYDFSIHGDDVLKDAYIWWLWPNSLWVAHHGISNWKLMHVLPTGLETCRQTVDYFFLNDPPTKGEVELMDYFTDVLQRQDITSMENQQRGVHCRGYSQGRLMVDDERSWRSEHGTHHFDKLLWEAVNGPNY